MEPNSPSQETSESSSTTATSRKPAPKSFDVMLTFSFAVVVFAIGTIVNLISSFRALAQSTQSDVRSETVNHIVFANLLQVFSLLLLCSGFGILNQKRWGLGLRVGALGLITLACLPYISAAWPVALLTALFCGISIRELRANAAKAL